MAHVYHYIAVSMCMWLVTTLAVLVDLWDGVYTAKKLGERVRSHKLRNTIRKIGEYWRIILMGFFADIILSFFCHWPYVSMGICLAVILIEGKSIIEHAHRRKGKASEITEMVAAIIDCASEKNAKHILNAIKKAAEENAEKTAANQH